MATKNQCAFWSCDETIPATHIVCRDHWDDYGADVLDECPSCGLLKDAQYPRCLDCKNGKTQKQSKGFFGRITDAVEDFMGVDVEEPPKSRSRTPRTATARKKTTPKPKVSSGRFCSKTSMSQCGLAFLVNIAK